MDGTARFGSEGKWQSVRDEKREKSDKHQSWTSVKWNRAYGLWKEPFPVGAVFLRYRLAKVKTGKLLDFLTNGWMEVKKGRYGGWWGERGPFATLSLLLREEVAGESVLAELVNLLFGHGAISAGPWFRYLRQNGHFLDQTDCGSAKGPKMAQYGEAEVK
ncbi:hypothetical protein [Paenibacillus sp. YN15]|uniref:hypothetical protein n=1 Tax=Paenibacillus sp. YN15 TaxID=1742774 RepID=UPI000DCF24B2|nr:hypothetical protein [Paenibacillus sp. YN15]RAV03446.1 hypothetical protein DQG13_06990 [Paenibacillus sp. YN15]